MFYNFEFKASETIPAITRRHRQMPNRNVSSAHFISAYYLQETHYIIVIRTKTIAIIGDKHINIPLEIP